MKIYSLILILCTFCFTQQAFYIENDSAIGHFHNSKNAQNILISGDQNSQLETLAVDHTNQKIYWNSYSEAKNTSTIYKANLDGSQIETVFSDVSSIRDLCVDGKNDRLIWVMSYDQVFFADLDGNLQQIVDVDFVDDIVINSKTLEIYWRYHDGKTSTTHIQRRDWHGRLIENIHSESDLNNHIVDIAIDNNGNIYWSEDIDFDTNPTYRLKRKTAKGVETVVKKSSRVLSSLSIRDNKIYWSNGKAIKKANLDGSQIEYFHINNNGISSINIR
ncbi:hypothetical protein [Candidatus Uabimicrobium sp. HlEnr_7]|uniref:hypothetical protein n=1 Tax=Candidatus Uabimicrobium helgolandensis TaxID=3095367 RepID=UPI003556821E